MSVQKPGDERPVVHLIDDDDRVRDSVAGMIDEARYRLESYTSGEAFLECYRPDAPGCILLDIVMPGISGLDLQAEIRRRGWATPIVFIAGGGRVSDSVQALKAGAVDFLEKPFTRETLSLAIVNALAKDRQDRSAIERQSRYQQRFARLTEREWEILTLMVAGAADRSSKQLARDLDISHRTVEHHRARIFEKTGASSVAELVKLAGKAGIIDDDDLID